MILDLQKTNGLRGKMTIEYKNLSQDLKYRYEAKIRLLKTYKSLYYSLLEKPHTLDDITLKEVSVNNLNKVELVKNINQIRTDLRNIHLARAFIRNVPYKKVEPNAKTKFEMYSVLDVLETLVIKHYKTKKVYDVLWNEVHSWEEQGQSSKFFAKPERLNIDANGSPCI